MFIIFVFISKIINSNQEVTTSDNKNIIMNKRKFMYENDTTMDITTLNTNYDFFNEHNNSKKLRFVDESLSITKENNTDGINIIVENHVENNLNLNDMFDFENESFDIMDNNTNIDDVNLTGGKNLEIQQCLDNQILLKNSYINLENNICSNQLCSEIIKDVGLEKRDNFNNDSIQNNLVVFERIDVNEISSSSEKTNKMDDNKCTNLGLKISNDEIIKYSNSVYFTKIFDIIFQDLLIILKSLKFYLNIKNEQINKFILTLEKVKKYEQKIIAFNNVTNQILNQNFDIIYTSKNHKFELLKLILKSSYKKQSILKSLKDKLFHKRTSLMNQIKYNNITYTDIFEYIIENINIIIDDNIRTICISGLQSIFINELKNAKPKFLNVLIVLFIFNNEKEHYDINWKEKILQKLSISNEYISNMNFFIKKYIESSKD